MSRLPTGRRQLPATAPGHSEAAGAIEEDEGDRKTVGSQLPKSDLSVTGLRDR